MSQQCPVATMDSFSREFLAGCHAHNPGAPCVYCGRDYEWHVWEEVYVRDGWLAPVEGVGPFRCLTGDRNDCLHAFQKQYLSQTSILAHVICTRCDKTCA